MKSLFPKHIGIHIRVLSAAVFLISATTFTMGYLGVTVINQFVTQRFNQRINFMAQYLALNSELGILIGEKNLLRGFADNMLKEDDIAGVEIIDHAGKIMVEVSRDLRGPFATVEKKVYLTETEEIAAGVDWLSGPREADIIGRVNVTYSLRGIKDLSRKMTLLFVYIGLILNGLACVMFYFVSRSLVAPLISLADTARKVSSGTVPCGRPSGIHRRPSGLPVHLTICWILWRPAAGPSSWPMKRWPGRKPWRKWENFP